MSTDFLGNMPAEEQEDAMKLYAQAKINLGLDVLEERPDGYHNIRTVMHCVSLCDVLTIEECEPGVNERIFLTTDEPGLAVDEGNLVFRAARVLLDEFAPERGVRIHLEKKIPMQAGLAGGSTDAAAALMGINTLFSLGLSEKDLMERGVKLGADVPFCIHGGAALAEGIGEKLTTLPALPSGIILLAKPAVSVSTKEAYDNLALDSFSKRPDMDAIAAGLRKGNLEAVSDALVNVFEPGISSLHKEIPTLRKMMQEDGAVVCSMTGSGPTVFGIFKDQESADRSADRIRNAMPDAFVYAAEPAGAI